MQFRARGGGGKHGFGIGEFELVGRRFQIQRTAIGFYGVAGPAAFKKGLRFQFPEIRVLGFGGKQAVQIFLGGVKVFLPHIIDGVGNVCGDGRVIQRIAADDLRQRGEIGKQFGLYALEACVHFGF